MSLGYIDPLDVIWRVTARRLGLTIVRSDQVYASTDGRGRLAIGAVHTLDPDDCLAQMVLHELCHWMINGPGADAEIDWGFAPMEAIDWREYAALRLQHHLCAQFGLIDVLAPTTDSRAYWDRLEGSFEALDPSDEEDRIVARACLGRQRSTQPPWVGPVSAALSASAAVVQACERSSQRRPQVPIDDLLWSFAGS